MYFSTKPFIRYFLLSLHFRSIRFHPIDEKTNQKENFVLQRNTFHSVELIVITYTGRACARERDRLWIVEETYW